MNDNLTNSSPVNDESAIPVGSPKNTDNEVKGGRALTPGIAVDRSKEEMLICMFKERRGDYISGEQISRQLGISRTAVWKHIGKLRASGYEFEAVSRKGYRLINDPADLTAAAIMAASKANVFGRRLKVLKITESTQEEVRRLAEQEAPEGTMVLAEEQTLGRGRMGRRWYSPPGKGLWMSLLLRPELPVSSAPQLTLLAAVAVCRAIRSAAQVDAAIKWPNDILIGGKKVCGIILESAGEDGRIRFAVAGIGIDVNLAEEELPGELADIMTSLRIESGSFVDRAALAGAILTELEQLYAIYLRDGFASIATLWEALSLTLNRTISVHTPSGVLKGTAEALDYTGALVVRTLDGQTSRIFSGDIEFIG